jgi:hypothetical protein
MESNGFDDVRKFYNQKEPLDITFEECWISQLSTERVAQTILSIMNPSFREEVPVQKYITGTVTVCDGYFSHKITFHSTGFTIHKPTAGETDEETFILNTITI